MRVFGGGFLVGPSGKYPSLKFCDEIDGKTIIQVERAGTTQKTQWSTIHNTFNRGWKRAYDKWKDSSHTDYSEKYKDMQAKMTAFWTILGPKYCQDEGLLCINKLDEIEDESK